MSGWDLSPEGATPPGQLPSGQDAEPSGAVTAPAAPAPAPPAPDAAAAEPVEAPAVVPRPPMSLPNKILHGFGEALITVGCVLLLFVVYEVWVSNFFAHRNQTRIHNAYVNGADPLNGQDKLNLPYGKQVLLPLGQGIANLYIPRFGKDYAQTIVEGTTDADLELGPGHYVGTAIPGQIGDFAVAGHRVGKGEPFLNLDKLHPGDAIVVQTKTNWYVYRVLGDVKRANAAAKLPNKSQRQDEIDAALATANEQGVVGREIVQPTDVAVIDPVPNHPDVTPTLAYMTMTTCHPKYSASQRMIIHAVIDRAVPVNGDNYPKEMPGGTL